MQHTVSSQYLAVDEYDPRQPPVLRSQPQAWEVSFLDEHLVTLKSNKGVYICCRSNWVMQSLAIGSTTVGDDERFMYDLLIFILCLCLLIVVIALKLLPARRWCIQHPDGWRKVLDWRRLAREA